MNKYLLIAAIILISVSLIVGITMVVGFANEAEEQTGEPNIADNVSEEQINSDPGIDEMEHKKDEKPLFLESLGKSIDELCAGFDELNEYSKIEYLHFAYNDLTKAMNERRLFRYAGPFLNKEFVETYLGEYIDKFSLKKSIGDFNEKFPIQKAVKINDEHICVIYRVTGSEYLYVIFEKDTVDDENRGEITNWVSYGEYYSAVSIDDKDYFYKWQAGDVITEDETKELRIGWYTLYFKGRGIITPINRFRDIAFTRDGLIVLLDIDTVEYGLPHDIKVVEIDYLPFGQASEKYPDMSILSDGFYPPVP